MPDPTSDKKDSDSLARIRENQRRSRARRKEYLSELENKWRACEQTGVEATAEVQAAARHVLEENKRLRALLRVRGVSDSEVDAFGLNGASNGGTYDQIPASMSLEAMLSERKPCNSCSSDGKCSPPTMPEQSTFVSQSLQPLQPHNADQAETESALPSVFEASPISARHNQNGVVFPENMGTSSVSTIYRPLEHASTKDQEHHVNDLSREAEASYGRMFDDTPTAGVSDASTTYSCLAAMDVIRGMGVDVGLDIAEALGCEDPSMCCNTNSSAVFDMLDHYQSTNPAP